MELLDNAEKLVEAQSQITKLQTSLDNIMKEKVQRHYIAIHKGVLAFQYFLTFSIVGVIGTGTYLHSLIFLWCFSALFLFYDLIFCVLSSAEPFLCVFVLILCCKQTANLNVNDFILFSFSLETWTLAAQNSSSKRNVLNNYAAATKPSTG